MQEILQKLQLEAGLSEDQASKALTVLTEYIHSKIPPMFSGFVDSFLKGDHEEGSSETFLNKAKIVEKETAEKIETITEEVKEEMEGFAKEAAEKIGEWALKADDAAKEALDKLKEVMNDPAKDLSAGKSK